LLLGAEAPKGSVGFARQILRDGRGFDLAQAFVDQATAYVALAGLMTVFDPFRKLLPESVNFQT